MKLILTFILSVFLTLGCSQTYNCIPENTLNIPVTAKSINTIDEAEFNKVIDTMERIYGPIVAEEGGQLKVFRKWDDGTVNAYAKRSGKTWEVHMFGGLARHAAVTSDGFMAVVCHEIGHHIGGAPKIDRFWNAWASNEGQSDYFATTKCLRKHFEEDLEETLKVYDEAKASQALKAKAACDEIFKAKAEAAVCYRASMAGKSLATLLGSLRGTPNVRFDTPDTSVVSKTDDNHPAAQCRLDTYFQGALCDKTQEVLPDQEDASVGFCMRKDKYKIGVRPLCWYKP